jgi:hypothetical protein
VGELTGVVPTLGLVLRSQTVPCAILLTCDKNDITVNLFYSLSDQYILVSRVCEAQVVPSNWCDLRRPLNLFVLVMLSAIDVRRVATNQPLLPRVGPLVG